MNRNHRLSTFICTLAAILLVSPNLAAKAPPVWWQASEVADHRLDDVLGEDAAVNWQFSAKDTYSIRDADGANPTAIVSEKRLVLDGRVSYGADVEFNCRVRLAVSETRPNVNFRLAVARQKIDGKMQEQFISLQGRHSNSTIYVTTPKLANSRYMHSNPELTGGQFPGSGRHTYVVKAYPNIQPTWEAIPRRTIEHDMSQMQDVGDKWVHLRIRVGKDWIRAWIDDRLLLDHQEAKLVTTGTAQMSFGPGAELAEFSVKQAAPSSDLFEPIALEGYARDRVLVKKRRPLMVADGALPQGQTVSVAGVPFSFVDPSRTGGADHIDVGRSLLRQANMIGHRPVLSQGPRFAGSMTVDPARLQLRVPNGRYEALYVVAAFDNEEDNIPLLSAQFYRPKAGFSMVFEGEVPAYSQRAIHSEDAMVVQALPTKLSNRRNANLWLVKIPLDPGMLSSFADMGFVEMELTKKVKQFRSYPDPIHYGWHGAGLPSGVHIYALTLGRPALHMEFTPRVFGHVWAHNESPIYDVKLDNRGSEPRPVELTLTTRSMDGEETQELKQKVQVPAGKSKTVAFTINGLRKFGYHDVAVTLTAGEQTWVEKRSLVRLHKDTRPAEWKEGEGPLFGYWSYHGGHYTPPGDEHRRLMKMAGARATLGEMNAWPITPQRSWAGKEPLDKEAYEAYKKTAIEKIKKAQGENPAKITFFPEPHVSRNLTAGNLPSYWGEPEYVMDEHEKKNLRVFYNTAKSAAEAVRAQWPNADLLIPWGDPLFIVPLLRAGFPKELIDGSGLDTPGFERLPEQQLHQISVHRIYCLKEEYKKFGLDPKLWFVEGIFVPTEPGACTWEEQANIHDRWALISLAYGVDRFYSGWFAFDCGSYYGSEHYGGCGIQRRIPYCNPKPAYASYATMTRLLAETNFDGWVPTGSHSTYCLKFSRIKKDGDPVFVLWTLRGERSVTLSVGTDKPVTVVDFMDNSQTMTPKDGKIEVVTNDSVVYITGAKEITAIELGEPKHEDAVAGLRPRNRDTWQTGPLGEVAAVGHQQQLGQLGDGSWWLDDTKDAFDEIYEDNNFDTKRYRGKMATSRAPGRDGQSALAVKLLQQDKERQLMPWYSSVRPSEPITIPGKADAIGLWVKGTSDWGRMVYCLRDANDEMWMSIGFKDQWNCDDVHSWSSFNFDGWRYLSFELPSHTEWDSFREYGTTWWRYAGGKAKGVGVVDLPLRLEKIIVERRTHVLYVNDIQETDAHNKDVLLGGLVAEYPNKEAVKFSAIQANRKRMPLPPAPKDLPNPIAEMTANELPAPRLRSVAPPDWGYDGTRCKVEFEPVDGVTDYQVWVAAHEDGRGAALLGRVKEPGAVVNGLLPATKLYLWLTYDEVLSKEAKAAKQLARRSQPSAALEVELVDAFGQK